MRPPDSSGDYLRKRAIQYLLRLLNLPNVSVADKELWKSTLFQPIVPDREWDVPVQLVWYLFWTTDRSNNDFFNSLDGFETVCLRIPLVRRALPGVAERRIR